MGMTKCQEKALEQFRSFILNPNQKEFVLSGSPGRGKSWLTARMIKEAASLSATLNILRGNKGSTLDFIPTATTGKAATVLSQMINMDASTTHSALGIRPQFNVQTQEEVLMKTGAFKVLPNSLLVIDEVSGINPHFQKLIREATQECKTLLIGDKRQIPAVGFNTCCVFDNPEVFAELEQPVRFDEDSDIAKIGRQLEQTIDTGKFKPITTVGNDVHWIDGDEFESLVSQYFTRENVRNDAVKIICWTNGMVREYNNHVRSLFTQHELFQCGERVVSASAVIPYGTKELALATEQVCTIKSMSPMTMYFDIPGRWVEVFESSKLVFMPTCQDMAKIALQNLRQRDPYRAYTLKSELADLRPPFATTAHKSQGSSYDYVFVDMDDISRCHHWSQVARMLNVAITRARKKVFLYGQLPNKYWSKRHAIPKK